MSNGAKQITYNGMPLYTFKGAKPLSTKGNGVEGKWHVIKLPGSAVTSTG
jgi:predicted lipoprotein with Yx(FWY)xxD motif